MHASVLCFDLALQRAIFHEEPTYIPANNSSNIFCLDEHSANSHVHKQELQPTRGVPQVIQPGTFPDLGLMHAGEC